MKVAHVITRMVLGGAQQNTLDSVRGLEALGGYDITLITGPQLGPEGDLLALSPEPGPKVLMIPSLKRNISPWNDFLAFVALVRIFTREKFDIVHTHSSKAGILGRFAARLAGVKRVIHTVHGFAVGPYQGKAMNGFYAWLERLAGRYTDALICVSPSLLEQAKTLGLRPGRLICVPSAFAWDDFERAKDHRSRVREELGILPHEIVLIKIARFFSLKGHEEFFAAMDSLLPQEPDVKALLVGGGELQGKFEEWAADRSLADRVFFTGLVAPARVPLFLAAADVLVHTSLREGIARVIPQAFACSLPVVSFDIDGARDLVKDGFSGFLVPSGDTTALNRALKRLIHNAALREQLGARGHDMAAQNYRLESMVASLDAIYQEALNS